MDSERIKKRRGNLQAGKTDEHSREMTENTVSLRETYKGIGVA